MIVKKRYKFVTGKKLCKLFHNMKMEKDKYLIIKNLRENSIDYVNLGGKETSNQLSQSIPL